MGYVSAAPSPTLAGVPPTASLADQLLDAQVRFHLDRLSGDEAAETIRVLAEQLLAVTYTHQLADLIDPDSIKPIVTRALMTVPGSAAVSGILDMAVEILSAGPEQSFTWGALVDRDQLVVWLDELFALTPVLDRALERLTASPKVGTMASRFMGRIANEVLATNQAIADKIPGLGGLVSLGTSAGRLVVGAADKQFEGVIGKGGAYAVRRLNRVLLDTLQDPTTREAILQVWDLLAAEPVVGLDAHLEDGQISGVVDAGHDLAAGALGQAPVAQLGAALVDGFFEWFGGYTPTELLDQLDLAQEDLVADLVRIAPGLLGALRASGDLEQLIRARLEPFYGSAEVRALLG